MSEADGYFHQQRKESSQSEMLCTREQELDSQSEMLCTREQELDRSFLPLKRKMFDQSNNEHLPERPPSKRFLAEESVVSHLEHLKLTPDCHWDDHTLPASREVKCRPLNMKTVVSCPHSTVSQISRKRDYGQCEGHRDSGSWSSKRMRLDPETRMMPTSAKNGNRTHCGMESDPHQHNSNAVLTSMHGIGSVSDLSSIPEEAEPNQQPSAPSGRCGMPLDPDSDTDGNELSVLSPLNPRLTLSSAFLSPSPAPPSPPPLTFLLASDTSKLNSDYCSVWFAPEIQTIQANALLPTSIVEEMEVVPFLEGPLQRFASGGGKKTLCAGMEVVPWMGLNAVLQGQVHREEESTESDELALHPSQQPSTTQTTSIADLQSCDPRDFGMELN